MKTGGYGLPVLLLTALIVPGMLQTAAVAAASPAIVHFELQPPEGAYPAAANSNSTGSGRPTAMPRALRCFHALTRMPSRLPLFNLRKHGTMLGKAVA